MAARVVTAVEQQLVVVLATAEAASTSIPGDAAHWSGHFASFASRLADDALSRREDGLCLWS
jgi:hypothetical protein